MIGVRDLSPAPFFNMGLANLLILPDRKKVVCRLRECCGKVFPIPIMANVAPAYLESQAGEKLP